MKRDPDYRHGYVGCVRTHATLRVFDGPEHPETVGEVLGLPCDGMRIEGRPGSFRDGEWRGTRIARHHGWSIRTEGRSDSRDAQHHIDLLLKMLVGREAALEDLRNAGWRTDIFVFWESGGGGLVLTPNTLRRLAETGLTLGYDIYFVSSEDESPRAEEAE